MATIAEIRKQYPQYNDMSDQQLADSMYAKHYSDMPKAQFYQKIGLAPQGRADGTGSLLMAGNVQATPRKAPVAPVSPRNKGTGNGLFDQTFSSINDFLIGIPEGAYNAAAAVTDPVVTKVAGMFQGDGVANATLAKARGDRQAVVNKASDVMVSRPSPYARMTGQIAGSTALAAPLKAPAILGKVAPVATRAVQGYISGGGVHDSQDSGTESGLIGAGVNIALPPLARWAFTKPVVNAVEAGARELRAVPQWFASNGSKYIGPTANKIVGSLDDAAESVLGYIKPKMGLDYTPMPTRPQVNPAAMRATAAQSAAQRARAAAGQGNIPLNVANADPLSQLGPSAQARFDQFRRSGVTNPTTGMVSRDPKQWTWEQEKSKVTNLGEPLVGQFQSIEKQLVDAGHQLHAGPQNAEQTGILAQKALATKSDEMQKVTSGLYRQVRETRGDVPAGQLVNFRSALENPDLLDNSSFAGMRDSLHNRLTRLGLAGPNMQRGNAVTITQAEELRKFIRGLGDSRDPTTQMIQKDLINALDEDVINTHGTDAFRAARESAKARFTEFKDTFAGKVADEGLFPEHLTKRLLSDGVSLENLREVRRSFTTGTPEQVARGQEAWDALKKQAVHDLLSPHISPEGKISGQALYKSFTAKNAKLREMLAPEEFTQLKDWVEASRNATVAPPFSAVNYSNTASAQANLGTLFEDVAPTVTPPKGGAGKTALKVGGQLAKHGAALAVGGPWANAALFAVDQGNALRNQVAQAAAQKAAEEAAAIKLAQQIQMAQNPLEAAAALHKLQVAMRDNPSIAAAVQRWQNLSINHPSIGGVAAGMFGSKK